MAPTRTTPRPHDPHPGPDQVPEPSATAANGRAARLAKQVAGAVGLISAIAGLVFLLFPQLQPQREQPTAERSAKITGMVRNARTTRGQFLDYSEQSKLGFTARQLAVVGASVFAKIEIVGHRGATLKLERQLIDAVTGDVVGEARDFSVRLDADRDAHPWWDWEPLRPGRGSYIIVIKVLDPEPGTVLACKESLPFGGLAGIVRATPPQLCAQD